MTALTTEQQAALQQLRDIRLPDPVGWWPLAPGWWALIALALLLILSGIAWRVLRRRTRRYAALHEFAALRQRSASSDAAGVATELAALLRRIALATDGAAVAKLSDTEWAEVLSAGKNGLSREVSDWIATAPYQRPEVLSSEGLSAIFAPTEAWIRRHA